jgi:hypothetical protein
MTVPVFDSDLEEDYNIPDSPVLNVIIFGKCDFPSCQNRAYYACDECHFVEHCRSCLETMMSRSEIYNIFMEGRLDLYNTFMSESVAQHQYTCIYCFMDIQKNELRSVSSSSPPMMNNEPITSFLKMSSSYNEEEDEPGPYR